MILKKKKDKNTKNIIIIQNIQQEIQQQQNQQQQQQQYQEQQIQLPQHQEQHQDQQQQQQQNDHIQTHEEQQVPECTQPDFTFINLLADDTPTMPTFDSSPPPIHSRKQESLHAFSLELSKTGHCVSYKIKSDQYQVISSLENFSVTYARTNGHERLTKGYLLAR